MSEITRNPLCWPDNVGRTAPHNRTYPQFSEKTITFSVNEVLREINRLNRRQWDFDDPTAIISSNLKLRQDGQPRGDQGEPTDPGVAVYFTLRFPVAGKWRERPCVLTCDRWTKVSWNLYAIAKDIEAQRGRERWGCTSLEQAFRGYLAIPERCGDAPWWTILGMSSTANREQIKDHFKTLAKAHHPDKGGERSQWDRLQRAFDQAMEQLGGGK